MNKIEPWEKVIFWVGVVYVVGVVAWAIWLIVA